MPPRRRPAAQPAPAGAESAANASEQDPATTNAPESSSQNPGDETSPSQTSAQAASSRPAPVSRTSSTRGKPVIAKPKFAGRRSQAARAELEKEAARKKAAEAAVATAEANKKRREQGFQRDGRGGRGGGRGGRGRGGFMGDHQSRHAEGIASGPFGSGQVSHDGGARRTAGGSSGPFGGFGPGSGGARAGGRSGGGGGGGGGSASFGGSGIKSEGGGHGAGYSRGEDGGYISSDEDETEGRKKNIDDLQRVIDLTLENEEDDDDMFAPVRLKREPHKDRAVAFNAGNRTSTTGASSNETGGTTDRKRGKQKAADVEITHTRPRRPTTYSSSDETDADPPIKVEFGEEESLAVDDAPVEAVPEELRSPPSSPDSKRKAKERIKEGVDELDLDEDDDKYPLPDEPKFQTQAEADEWHRHYADLDIIRKELGRQVRQPPTATGEGDGDVPMSSDDGTSRASERAKKAEEIRSEHVYLFQFPPVLPDLSPVSVKQDPEGAASDAMDIDPAPTEVKPMKEESGAANVSLKPSLPSGCVGKLRVHKSGKAVLDWGGVSLVLSLGTDPSFLQNILVAKVPETKPGAEVSAEEAPPEAIGMGMGQVRGKFVITPNWDEILR